MDTSKGGNLALVAHEDGQPYQPTDEDLRELDHYLASVQDPLDQSVLARWEVAA